MFTNERYLIHYDWDGAQFSTMPLRRFCPALAWAPDNELWFAATADEPGTRFNLRRASWDQVRASLTPHDTGMAL